MIPKRNNIPKRLIGARGVRLIQFPGLTYPSKVLKEAPVADLSDTAPLWGICTADAANILGCARSTTRTMLHKYEVRKQKVRRPKLPPIWYWDKYQVEAIAAARCKEVCGIPPLFMCAKQVCAYLRISRSTLTRYEQQGLLKAVVCRMRSGHAACLSHLFLAGEVRCLFYHMNAIKHKYSLDTLEPADLPTAPTTPANPQSPEPPSPPCP